MRQNPLATGLVPFLAACGGGGGAGDVDDLVPLWVPTDVAVDDVDGDGAVDVAVADALPAPLQT